MHNFNLIQHLDKLDWNASKMTKLIILTDQHSWKDKPPGESSSYSAKGKKLRLHDESTASDYFHTYFVLYEAQRNGSK